MIYSPHLPEMPKSSHQPVYLLRSDPPRPRQQFVYHFYKRKVAEATAYLSSHLPADRDVNLQSDLFFLR